MQTINILTDAGSKALCNCTVVAQQKYSKHNITYCTEFEINDYKWNDYDLVHVNGTICDQFFTTTAKTIYNIHAYILSCPPGGLYCTILNKFLNNPLTCYDCLGYLGLKTGSNNLTNYIKMAKHADILAVHSEYMKDFYHMYNPTYLPLPLETDILTPCEDKDDYLLYTGRLSFEKNPYGFINIVNRTGMKGKMIIYHHINKELNIGSHYEDILNNKYKNIEVILNPSKEYMIELTKHAKFIVLPYFFAEPFGVAAANSILCGTPVIAFPYGNYVNMTHLLPKTLNEMVKLCTMSEEQYSKTLEQTMKKSKNIRTAHDPLNVVKLWDNIYSRL